MIGEAIRSILPLGLEEEIGSKLMCLVAGCWRRDVF